MKNKVGPFKPVPKKPGGAFAGVPILGSPPIDYRPTQVERIGYLLDRLDRSGAHWTLYRSWCAPEEGAITEVRARVRVGSAGPQEVFFEPGDGPEAIVEALQQAVDYVEMTTS